MSVATYNPYPSGALTPALGTPLVYLAPADVTALVALGAAPGWYIDGPSGLATINVRNPSGSIVGTLTPTNGIFTTTSTTVRAGGQVPSSGYSVLFFGQAVLVQTTVASPWDGTKLVVAAGVFTAPAYLADGRTGAVAFAPGGYRVAVDGSNNPLAAMTGYFGTVG